MSTATSVCRSTSIWRHIFLFGIIGLFVATGALRLNECDLFNPDSPRYVIYSQAIVNLGGYQATDLPGSPVYSWRPPGLSLMLAPVMSIRPYDVIAAKIVILIAAAFLLYLTYRLTALYAGHWAGCLVTAVIASSPGYLVLSTEVLTEIPYALGVMIVLFLLGQSTFDDDQSESSCSKQRKAWCLGFVIVTLAFTPWLRTIGVALVAAVGVWSLFSRRRFRWLIAVCLAAVGLGLLSLRNHLGAGENYVGNFFGRFRERGLGPMVASGFDTIQFYCSAIQGILLPGLVADRPWYAPLTLESLPTLNASIIMAMMISGSVILIALLGMWSQRSRGGLLCLLYLAIYCCCLTVWPWKHERFLWPLVPVVLAFVPAGLSCFCKSINCPRVVPFIAFLPVIGLIGWQSVAAIQIVNVNREYVRDRDAFYLAKSPGFYFSDWRHAGSWLNAHSPQHSRVLTWHAAVGGTSHRFQKRVQFEATSPEKLRREIEAFSAKYLVVPNAQFGDGFGWRQCFADPALRLEIVFSERDVTILEVLPNRTGEISATAYVNWVEQQLKRIEDVRRENPNRIDLAVRNAGLLRECGRPRDAIQILRELIDRGAVTARICAELGWLFFEAEEYADAAKFLDRARQLPNSESIAATLMEGAERARELQREKNYGTGGRSIPSHIRRAKGLIAGLDHAAAECEIEEVLKIDPNHVEANYLTGQLAHLRGDVSAASSRYERAIQLGNTEALKPLLLIRYVEAMTQSMSSVVNAGNLQETVDRNDPSCHVRLAKLFLETGWSGRALATLEMAAEKFPNQAAIQLRLAELELKFAHPELALPLYQTLHEINPGDESVFGGLRRSQAGLRQPQM